MNLGHTGFFDNTNAVYIVHTTSGHDYDATGSLLLQFAQHLDAFFCGGALTGRQHPIHTEADESFESGFGVAAEVERTMESDADGRQEVGLVEVALGKVHILAFSGFDEAFAGFDVNIAICCQRAYYNAINACTARSKDIVDDDVLLGFGIKEIASARADQHMFARALNLQSGLDEADAWGKAAFVKSAAEFHALRSAESGVLHRQKRPRAYFQNCHNYCV